MKNIQSTLNEVDKEVKLSLRQLNSVVLNTKFIEDLTLAGIRDTNTADLREAISSASSQLRFDLHCLDQDLTIKINSSLPRVLAGQNQLKAAIKNLLSTAIDAAGEHGVIRMRATYISENVF